MTSGGAPETGKPSGAGIGGAPETGKPSGVEGVEGDQFGGEGKASKMLEGGCGGPVGASVGGCGAGEGGCGRPVGAPWGGGGDVSLATLGFGWPRAVASGMGGSWAGGSIS